jgi:hypothetical protein
MLEWLHHGSVYQRTLDEPVESKQGESKQGAESLLNDTHSLRFLPRELWTVAQYGEVVPKYLLLYPLARVRLPIFAQWLALAQIGFRPVTTMSRLPGNELARLIP